MKIGCIFEDDVTLKSGFLKQFTTLYHELPADWDIFLLSHFCHQSGCEANNGLKPISKNLMPNKNVFFWRRVLLERKQCEKIAKHFTLRRQGLLHSRYRWLHGNVSKGRLLESL